MSDRRFFNEEIETLPKNKLQALQLQRLQAIVERVYNQNEFYRSLYERAGVKPSDITSLEDIRKLPFLEKKTVRAAYPYGMALSPPAEMGVDFRESKLKIGLFGAEPWPWETRLKLEDYFNIRAYDEFGMTEFLGPGMTCECENRNGMHAWADAFLVECIDPESGEPVAD